MYNRKAENDVYTVQIEFKIEILVYSVANGSQLICIKFRGRFK